ncbi:MAG TPA: bifunctional UDP-3-O-[3-hydroxymyristoyl] N-acetylglucosamine deacetylase/3-hydroxyacyl-ACP dehydratase, partial [Saprospiraceae bacterium]|nr:bifunctional UDP-3-O-[3-hydroxymyristoyl] N-acetylglucosamine deacetylase/3-hydroxyacyl-ACP dehydratase [Saprospiraceae bacterium]
MKQHTIKKEVTVKGVGLHTGKAVTMTFKPAPVNHGYKFQRIDLENKAIISADANKVITTNRGTTLQSNGAELNTVEHVLSALVGLEIDNVLIEIDGPEVPILDGSAEIFINILEEAELVAQDAEREYFEITEPIAYKDETTGAELYALPAEHFQVTTMIDFNSDILGQQYASLENISAFKKEIAGCRTFVFLHELDALLNQGLIKGGDLDNAIVIVDKLLSKKELSSLAKRLNKKNVKVEKEGILNTTDLKFRNEPARHKLLDVIGDLALVGKPIKGKIVATKPGHTANVAFAKILKKAYQKKRKLKGKPHYDPNKEPVYNTVEITKRMPHRYPFLLVDKIIELTDTHVVGV